MTIKGITINPRNPTIEVGKSLQFFILAELLDNGTRKITGGNWSATGGTIERGKYTPTTTGTFTVACAYNEFKDDIKVNVVTTKIKKMNFLEDKPAEKIREITQKKTETWKKEEQKKKNPTLLARLRALTRTIEDNKYIARYILLLSFTLIFGMSLVATIYGISIEKIGVLLSTLTGAIVTLWLHLNTPVDGVKERITKRITRPKKDLDKYNFTLDERK